jgi:hypothetical protein
LSGFIQSKLRGILEHSEDANGSKPEEAFYPYRYLPIWMLDTTLDDGVVIPKGTIVSVLSSKTAERLGSQDYLGFGEIIDASSIYIGVDYTGGVIQANIDTSFWGYTDAVAGLLIPANGGVDASGGVTDLDSYSTLDTGRTINPASAAYVALTTGTTPVPYTRRANWPVGVVSGDVYQDIRGAHLNYQVWNIWGIKMRGYIEVPFVDLFAADVNGQNKDDTFATVLDSASIAGTILPDAPWYVAVARKHAFLYNPSDSANLLVPGSLLKSDIYGKFVPEYVVPSAISAGSVYGAEGVNFARALGDVTLAAPVTAQTVGKLVITDSRFPKDMLETVTTYPASNMPGTDTGGLPAILYNFVYDVMLQSGDSRFTNGPSLVQMLDMVQAGIFGTARIQLVLA